LTCAIRRGALSGGYLARTPALARAPEVVARYGDGLVVAGVELARRPDLPHAPDVRELPALPAAPHLLKMWVRTIARAQKMSDRCC
jgi:hypothetical protein